MPNFRTFVVVALAMVTCLTTHSSAADAPKAYPITLEANDVYELAKLSIQSNGLKISGTDIIVVPIRCELGMTGAMLIGKGEYAFSPDDGDEQKGIFRAAMLRFAPADQPKLLPLDGEKPTSDLAAHTMSKHLLKTVFWHCWQSGGTNALIPDAGSFVANVYSTTQGDLLISTGPELTVVHSFTENKTLYTTK